MLSLVQMQLHEKYKENLEYFQVVSSLPSTKTSLLLPLPTLARQFNIIPYLCCGFLSLPIPKDILHIKFFI
jgi:hypothetical protein